MDTSMLRAELAKHGMIAIIWSVEDVLDVRPDLTSKQAFLVLQRCGDEHDATVGLDWDIIRIHAEEMFPNRQSRRQSE